MSRWRGGTPRPADVRFWEKVEKTETCWLWVAAIDSGGYGMFGVGDGVIRAHRYSYIATKGEIPAGLMIDHLCRVRRCVNPDHLEAVTNRENQLRGPGTITTLNTAKTHCAHGHAYAEHGAIERNGARRCNECCRIRVANRRAAMTEQELDAERAQRREKYARKRAS